MGTQLFVREEELLLMLDKMNGGEPRAYLSSFSAGPVGSDSAVSFYALRTHS